MYEYYLSIHFSRVFLLVLYFAVSKDTCYIKFNIIARPITLLPLGSSLALAMSLSYPRMNHKLDICSSISTALCITASMHSSLNQGEERRIHHCPLLKFMSGVDDLPFSLIYTTYSVALKYIQ